MRFTRNLRQISLVAGILCAGLYSLPGLAAISRCAIGTISGGPYTIADMPTTLTNGFVVASRVMTTSYTYRKTGSSAEDLLTGAWYTTGRPSTTYHTLPVTGTVQGLGFRMSNLGSPGGYASGSSFNILNMRSATAAGTSLSAQDLWLQELVITDANLYKGGTITGVANADLTLVFGNQRVWDDKNVTSTTSRCSALYMIMGLNILAPEGGGSSIIPELPEPKNPTCDLGGVNIAVNLPDVDRSTLQNSGDISGGKPFSIPLGNCGKDAKPYITFTDSNNKANRSTTLGLATGSTAAGVGIVLEKSGGELVQFGAQNTSVSSSNVGQFLIGTSAADGSAIPLNMTAKYIRTKEDLKAGEVKADAIFTIAYP
jgi:type 1 fimbria pilin